MKKYICYRCGYENHIKTHFIKHLNRINICLPKLEDITINEVKKRNYLNFEPEMNQIEPEMNQNEPEKTKNNVICTYCESKFSTKSSLKRHIKSRCEVKMALDEKEEKKEEEIKFLKEELKRQDVESKKREGFLLDFINEQTRKQEETLKIEREEMKKQMELILDKAGDTTTNSHNTQHTNSHNTQININNYGREDTSHITPQYMSGLLKFGPKGAIPKLTKAIHFNDKKPENNNIKITNKKMPYISIYKDNRWLYRDKDEVIQEMVEDKYNMIESHYDEHGEDDLNKRQQERYQKYRREMDEVVVNDTQKYQKKELDLLILNYSKK